MAPPAVTASGPSAAVPSGRPRSAPRLRAPRRRHSADRPRRSVLLTLLTSLVLLYSLVPLVWLAFSATKTQEGLSRSFGLWFDGDFALWDNIGRTFTYDDGVFTRWLLNTVLYVGLGAGAPPSSPCSAATRSPSSTSRAGGPSSPS